MGDFKLSASLAGHDDDVRAVIYPNKTFLVSASRDGTVRVWDAQDQQPPNFDPNVLSTGSKSVNSLTFLPPTSAFTNGLVVSGSQDSLIELRQRGSSPEANAEALLLGHGHNVCALDVEPSGQWVVSGGWDAQCRVWSVGKWETEVVLEGHTASVWAVLAWDSETVITGCADQLVRIYHVSGKLLRTIKGIPDVIRALCKLPKNHSSGGHFASASNDGVIRLWTLDGNRVGELYGHDSFIYSLSSLPTGEIVSCGEDRTLKIWGGGGCIQTITHPAVSVWSVAVCQETGDIVSGSSDRIVRVFTRSQDRQADPAVIKSFEDAVKGMAIAKQAAGDFNKEKLPGPEFLQQKQGTKDGQNVMILEPNGDVTAHQWSMNEQQWITIGTVVEGAGSSGVKETLHGKEYDYVIDVDVEDGKPPLKLGYNMSENVHDVARRFLEQNELPMTYLEQVANFIAQNTKQTSIGAPQPTEVDDSGPWGTGNRYRPGDDTRSASPPRQKILPQKEYLSIRGGKLQAIQKKLEELNDQLIKDRQKDLSLNPSDIEALRGLAAFLEEKATSPPVSSPPALVSRGVDLVLRMVTDWPPSHRLPALDLLRLSTAATPFIAEFSISNDDDGGNIIDVLARTGVFADLDRPNNAMLAVRTLANFFLTEPGRALADADFDKIQSLTSASIPNTTNRPLQTAYTTLLINYSVLITTPGKSTSPSDQEKSLDRALTLLHPVTTILTSAATHPTTAPTPTDTEPLYRALVALGTLLTLGGEVLEAARDVLGVKEVVENLLEGSAGGEARVRNVGAEIGRLLG
ncbi:MAG: hypothetical protein M1833_002942 [Piccolia ochrophora]|nr:MAG: hypothetical protein M1833_002942 [Piccolia ochrophora]